MECWQEASNHSLEPHTHSHTNNTLHNSSLFHHMDSTGVNLHVEDGGSCVLDFFFIEKNHTTAQIMETSFTWRLGDFSTLRGKYFNTYTLEGNT